MESRYGIGINNRYALFLDSEDGEDLMVAKKKPVEPTPTKPIETTPTPKPVKKPEADKKPDIKLANNQNNRATKDSKPNNKEDKENRNNRFEGKRVLDARKSQEGPRESREERNNRRNKAPGEGGAPLAADGDGAKRGGGRGGARGGRGGRGGIGNGRGGGAGGNRGKRDFDRKSGDDKTGVKAVDKKEGSGSHNWGTFEDEMKAEEDKANVSADMNDSAAEADNVNEPSAEEIAAMEAKRAAEEEEARTMTLDEWKKQQGEKDKPKFNLRKAGEGSDLDPKWKKTYAYKKERETQDDSDDEDAELYPQRANRQKKLLDIEYCFNDPTGPVGADRGGRGGGRGGRGGRRGGPKMGGRGGPGKPRVGKGGSEAPNVNDQMSFPALG